MRKKLLLLFYAILFTKIGFAQIIEKQANQGDNVNLNLPVTVRGTIQWQTSPDNQTYTNMTGKTTKTLQLTAQQTAYYRAVVTEGTCQPLYSDITKVNVESSGGGDLPNTVTDIEGNTYKTVVIGTQTWMAENLKTTKYNDGTAIPNVTDNTAWSQLSTPAYCWYNNDAATYKDLYGALYNWHTVETSKLCPTGWHVPSDDEWKTLEMHLGMSQTDADNIGNRGTNEGIKLKSTSGWNRNNGTNESGFNALPGGYRGYSLGSFSSVSYYADFWTSTPSGSSYGYVWKRQLQYAPNSIVERDYASPSNGRSIRCVQD